MPVIGPKAKKKRPSTVAGKPDLSPAILDRRF
jgi:hypothetical protein